MYLKMTESEKRVFSETYTQVFVKMQLEREPRDTRSFYQDLSRHEDKEDAAAASGIAERTVLSLRAALTAASVYPDLGDVEKETAGPAKPGGFSYL